MAVEPQMQRKWEEQLAGYVTASFRVNKARFSVSGRFKNRVSKRRQLQLLPLDNPKDFFRSCLTGENVHFAVTEQSFKPLVLNCVILEFV